MVVRPLPGTLIEFPGTNHSLGTPDALLGPDQVIPETPQEQSVL